MSVSLLNVQQRRHQTSSHTSNVRSLAKSSCSNCRTRQLQCEDAGSNQESCRNCSKAGRVCDGLIGRNSQMIIAPQVQKLSRGQLEEETFDVFVQKFAPWLGKFTDEAFWIKSILPAAHGNDAVFSGVLAVTALYDMPINEALPSSSGAQSRYSTAISWYRNSVRGSIGSVASSDSVPDISILLLTTILYLNIEMRQGHYHNLHGLLRTAFSLVYSARTNLWKSKDSTVLACLTQLLEGGISLAIDIICVPRSHRDFTIVLALRLAAELGSPEIDQLRLELHSIIYDVSDRIIASEHAQKETCCIIFSVGPCPALAGKGVAALDEPEDVPFERDVQSLEERMREWYKRFVKYKASIPVATNLWFMIWRQELMFIQIRAQWQAHWVNKYRQPDQPALQQRLSALLEVYEEYARSETPSWITDMGIVPPCLTVIWYWRDESVLERVMKIFKMYNIYNKNDFMKNVQAYFKTLTYTDASEATEIELELFGYKPTIFKKWQCFMCVQYLVRKKAPGV